MGNTNKHVKESTFKTTHPNLNKAKVIEDEHRKYIQAVFKAQSKEYEDWQQSLKLANCSPNHFLLLPEKSTYKDDKGLCGNTGTLTNQYPCYPYLLSELIKQRHGENKLFKESELWYALFAMNSALQEIKKRSLKLGDIKPENVFVNEIGQIKIANIYSWPHERVSYQKVLEFDKNEFNSLLAPEDMALLQSNHLDNDGNDQSEMFAIGATILSTATLDTMHPQVYNVKERAINLNALREKKLNFGEGQKYSDIFKALVLNLVAVSPSERLTSDQLWNFIAPFESSIVKKQQFMIPGAPQKIEMSMAALKNKMY